MVANGYSNDIFVKLLISEIIDPLPLIFVYYDTIFLTLQQNHTLNHLDILEGCVLHSDQGSVYTSHSYYKLFEEKDIIRSVSRKGTPADNAPIEIFHSTLKCETFYLNNELKSSNSIVIDIVENHFENSNNLGFNKISLLIPS
ncbi:DDE-type integrase/transposase/recombinase [Staphylococcus agnetis]|nr:DDE-type integrase/transposase/recombinase [Staphylococcus agnetis]NJI14704.1 DDE-type integrase/transposase/recombinase [Staphylococcus agnetis]